MRKGSSQVEKAKHRFGCDKVVFVGDRGMIKSGQIKDLQRHGFHYITSLTKKEIERLLKKKVVKYELFDDAVYEVIADAIRYIFRRNPIRAQEIQDSRKSKQQSIEKFIEQKNNYLQKHKKAKGETAFKHVTQKIKKLKADHWLSVKLQEGQLFLVIDNNALSKEAECWRT